MDRTIEQLFNSIATYRVSSDYPECWIFDNSIFLINRYSDKFKSTHEKSMMEELLNDIYDSSIHDSKKDIYIIDQHTFSSIMSNYR